MKKSVLRLGKILSAIVLATVVMFTGTNTVNGAANSIKVGKVTILPGYVAGVKFHIKPLVGGGYAYCLNIHKETASNVTEYLKGEMDAGVAYILENGYPKKSFTGNKKKDFYITQGALWWYLDDTTGTANLGNGFKKTGSDSYGLRKYMKKLVSGAKDAKKAGYNNPSMSASITTTKMNLDGSESKYTSNKVTVKTKNISTSKAELANGPKGAYVADVNGNKKTSFNAGDKFIVVVPASSIKAGKTETAKVNVTATSTIYKAYKYAPKNSSVQPMTILQPVSKTVKSSVTVKASKPEAPKCKYDATKNIYYGIDGRVVTKEVYEDECLPKRYCEYDKDQDKYYGKNGKVVTKEQYIIECSENSVTIYKVDKNTNNTIAGAVLVIKDANGNAIKEFTSTINGYNITGLANGKYTVEEKIAPKGYELSKNIETFTLSDTSKSVKVYFYNIPKSRTVIINKVDSTTGKASWSSNSYKRC